MSKSIETQIKINARPEKVWSKLIDFYTYPSWNPFITSIEGRLYVEALLKVIIQPPNASKMTFTPKVIAYEEYKLLAWKGKLFVNGLFDGVHKFELVEAQNGTTIFKQSELFSGLLVHIFNLENTKRGFIHMNEALKILCEQER